MTLYYRAIGNNTMIPIEHWDRYVADPERDVLVPWEIGPGRMTRIPQTFLARDWPGLVLHLFVAHVPEKEPGLGMRCLLARAATPQQAFHFKLANKSLTATQKAIIRWHELQP